jgi:glycine oxidase
VKTWDVIVAGAGIIGLSLALELRRQGRRVLVVEKGEPGREASWAAGGMLCDFPAETPPALRELAAASARMYPEFVRELQEGSGHPIDLRSVGTLIFCEAEQLRPVAGQSPAIPQAYALPRALNEMEAGLQVPFGAGACLTPLLVQEKCVDPRGLTIAAIAAARHKGIDFSGDRVLEVQVADGKVTGVRTNSTQFGASIVVNCSGAWAGQIGPHSFPTRPVKGQMLSLAMPEKNFLRHVVRTPEVYLIPRSDGRLVIGATTEEAGFDKQVVPQTIEKQRQAAIALMPALADAPVLETWAGLRPGTPDRLPILGLTSTPGYFVATGHYRDGILLAPVTARVMGQVIAGKMPEIDLSRFSAGRFLD